MKHRYKKYGVSATGHPIVRPVIPIKLMNGEKEVWYDVLVDSGADRCIFDAQIAELLDIKVTDGKQVLFAGITGSQRISYLHTISLEINGIVRKAEVSFAQSVSPMGYGVVGQLGFFEFFPVKFDYKKGEIEIG
jgi:hypothetical protein